MQGVYYDLDATSTLALPSLTTALNSLFEIEDRSTAFASLTMASGTIFDLSQSTVQLANLKSLPNGSIELSLESSVQAPVLSNINGTNVVVQDGSVLALPGVTTYSSGPYDRVLSVEGIGSSLALSNLTYITGGTAYDADLTLQAVSGGLLDLSSVENIVDPSTGDTSYRRIRVVEQGTNSRIDLSSLASFVDVNGTSETGPGEWSDLIEADGGVVNVPWETVYLSGVNVIRGTGAAGAALGAEESSPLQAPGDEPLPLQDGEQGQGEPTYDSTALYRQNRWVGGAGDWSQPANWSKGRVPEITDIVIIPAGAGVAVTISSGTAVVGSLECVLPSISMAELSRSRVPPPSRVCSARLEVRKSLRRVRRRLSRRAARPASMGAISGPSAVERFLSLH